MALKILCPNCKYKLSVPEKLAGKSASCPVCQRAFNVCPPLDGWAEPAAEVPRTVSPPFQPASMQASAACDAQPRPGITRASPQPPPATSNDLRPTINAAAVTRPATGAASARHTATANAQPAHSEGVEKADPKTETGHSGGCAAMVAATLVAAVVALKKSAAGAKLGYVFSRLTWFGWRNPKTHDITVTIVAFVVGISIFSVVMYWTFYGLKRLLTLLFAPSALSIRPSLSFGQLSATPSAPLTATPQSQPVHQPNTDASPGNNGVAQQWWLASAGQVSGPAAATEIENRARAGKLAADTQVCKVGDTKWMPLTDWLRRQQSGGPTGSPITTM